MTTESLVSDDLGTALRGAIEKFSAAPEGSTTVTFRSDTKLLHNLLTEARIRQFNFQIDEPQSLGGTDQGPNPVELILAALGTCQEIVYAAYAAVLGIQLDDVAIRVSGPLDPRGLVGVAPVPMGFTHVEMQTHIASIESPERIQGLIQAVQAHCPVLEILQQPLEVRNQVELNGAQLPIG